jgi:uncharacterized OsmC-like protein
MAPIHDRMTVADVIQIAKVNPCPALAMLRPETEITSSWQMN